MTYEIEGLSGADVTADEFRRYIAAQNAMIDTHEQLILAQASTIALLTESARVKSKALDDLINTVETYLESRNAAQPDV